MILVYTIGIKVKGGDNMSYTTGYYTVDRHCHCCGKIIPANTGHYVHEKIKGCGILDFHVCEECHSELYEPHPMEVV